MRNNKKLTKIEIDTRLLSTNIVLVGEYTNCGTKTDFRCHCGKIFFCLPQSIFRGETTSCGCYKKSDKYKGKFKDLSGNIYGKLTVIKVLDRQPYQKTRYLCKCECGIEKTITGSDLQSGRTVSCGCHKKQMASISRFVDLTGKKFNRLTVIELIRKNNLVYYQCLCDCGNITIVQASKILNGSTKSCGCLISELRKRRGKNHPNYKPELTEKDRIDRRTMPEHKEWSKRVKERDNFTCQICGKRGYLESHHLDAWKWCEERRFDITNGITICKDCHKDFHKKCGRGNNTKQQFNSYLEIRGIEWH